MTCDCLEEEITVVRKLNRTLRTMNRSLRLQLKQAHEHADVVFNALCNADTTAEAIGELWEFGAMDCSPEDVSYIVERCLEALEFYASHKPASAQALSDESGLLFDDLSN